MTDLSAAEIIASIDTAVSVSLGVMAVLGGLWVAFGRPVYKRVIHWFEKLEKRFDIIDDKQQEAQIERETATRVAEQRDTIVISKLEHLTNKVEALTTTVQDHHGILFGSAGQNGLIQEVAYFRGRDDERRTK